MRIEFEVLFQTVGGDGPSAIENLEAERPTAGDLVRCGRWLAAQGVETHRTEFSVVCSCEHALFERLFATHLVAIPGEGNGRPFACDTPPVLPQALRDCVASIELAGRPIFFP